MELTGSIFVLFSIILIGYVARKIKLLPDHGADVLVRLILNITLPLLIVVSLNLPYEPALFAAMIQTAVVATVATAVIILVARLLSRRLPLDEVEKRQWQFMLVFGNVTFIGYPICFLLLGEPGVFLAAVFDMVQTVLMFSYGIVLLSGTRRGIGRQELNLLKDPVILALILGVILFMGNISLPQPLEESFSLVGSTTTALSMLAVGLLLEFRRSHSKGAEAALAVLVFLKLLVVPLLFVFISKDLGIAPNAWLVSVIMLSVPSGILSTVLSVKYTGEGRFAAQGVFWTHLLCILTIPLLLRLVALF